MNTYNEKDPEKVTRNWVAQYKVDLGRRGKKGVIPNYNKVGTGETPPSVVNLKRIREPSVYSGEEMTKATLVKEKELPPLAITKYRTELNSTDMTRARAIEVIYKLRAFPYRRIDANILIAEIMVRALGEKEDAIEDIIKRIANLGNGDNDKMGKAKYEFALEVLENGTEDPKQYEKLIDINKTISEQVVEEQGMEI